MQSLREVRSGFAAVGDRVGEAQAINATGIVEMHLGRFDDALKLDNEALVAFRNLGDRYGEATSFMSLGDVFGRQARYAQAHTSYEDASKLYREIGAAADEKVALRRLTDAQSSPRGASAPP
ncbi:MAG: tetratricopeptide repeat protein [Candidatus Eremiobacteraeota bacterium]|nr:tetratricopeptide repeat protein [Candidatus Eremiobacteraeota bacterium]